MKGQPHGLTLVASAVSLALLVLPFALYIRTLAPTITWQHDGYDAGDLITAAYTLGIPHPTGYPLYTLLGKLFTLLPFGDVAYRMNMMSAFCAALTAPLLYWTSLTLLRSRPYAILASACAALLLSTSRVLWSQAVITEVYTLNCLFFATILYLVLRLQPLLSGSFEQVVERTRIVRIMMLIALIYGLSLGNHLTMLLTAPLLFYQCMIASRLCTLRTLEWARVLGMFLLGLSVYIYLPLRAGSQPLLNWGNPGTLRGFVWVVSGSIYRQYVFALPLGYWPERLLAWAGLLRQQFGTWGTALGLLGAWKQAKRSWQLFGILVLTSVLFSTYAIGYNTTDSYVYLLPVYFLYALWIAEAVQTALSTLPKTQGTWSKRAAVLSGLALLALPLGSLRANLQVLDLSNDYTAHHYGSQVFAQVPDGSIIISATDAHTFTLWYFARVVTGRTTVALIDEDLLGYHWYVDGLREAYPWLDLSPTSMGIPLTVDDLIQANIQRHPIFLTDVDSDLIAHYRLQEQGALYQLLAR
ncbi:MAG: DUF2723 domain-containing protein [Chloroflexi bacterium]|nr:DUF2723 domain-containing protein [Chloroflexota bacterium]